MAQKRDDYEEDNEDIPNSRFLLDKLTATATIAFIILAELFLYFLKVKTGAEFGIVQIIFGIIAGVVIALFLIWVRFIIAGNKYLGTFISLVAILAVPYALTRKYQGTYTTTFMIIGIVMALAYTIFYFVKAGKK